MLSLEVGYEGANMANNFSRPATMLMLVVHGPICTILLKIVHIWDLI
jgi:hypothetical protein